MQLRRIRLDSRRIQTLPSRVRLAPWLLPLQRCQIQCLLQKRRHLSCLALLFVQSSTCWLRAQPGRLNPRGTCDSPECRRRQRLRPLPSSREELPSQRLEPQRASHWTGVGSLWWRRPTRRICCQALKPIQRHPETGRPETGSTWRCRASRHLPATQARQRCQKPARQRRRLASLRAGQRTASDAVDRQRADLHRRQRRDRERWWPA